MADTRSTKDLFRAWRSGDAEAGQAMAQRFADWYYAIATSRLGEKVGREPCEKACARFGEGVVKVTDSRALAKWAHDIIVEEVATRGGRTRDGDEPTAYTGQQRPKQLLAKCRRKLEPEMKLLEAVYTGQPDEIADQLAAPLGGMPIAVLKARYRVKQWLRDNAKVPFEVAPDDPVLDRAPMPLYESGRMASAAEEANFEQWMLTDLDLCKDIAEFAQFAIALRGGLPADTGAATPAPAPRAVPAPAEVSSGIGGKAALGGAALFFAIAGALAVVAVIGAIVVYFVL